MQRELDRDTARNSLRAIRRYLFALFGLVYGGCSWGARQARTTIRAGRCWAGSVTSALSDSVSAALGAKKTRRVLDRMTEGLIGIRPEVSLVALLTAPVLALGTEWWVVTTSSYPQIESMAVGTWTGTNPEPLVFVGVVTIIAIATLFTVFNSGLIPATVLAMAPTFGIGFARYGLRTEYYGTVGIPDAAAIGLIITVVIGLPLGVTGFLIGTVLRRMRRYFQDQSGADGASVQT